MSSHISQTGHNSQYPLERDYNKLVQAYRIDSMEGFRPLAEVKAIDTEYRQNLIKEMTEQYPSTFNLWQGKKYKSNILKYKKGLRWIPPNTEAFIAP